MKDKQIIYRFQPLIYYTSFVQHKLTPALHTGVNVDGYGALQEDIVSIMIVMPSADKSRQRPGTVIDITIYFRATSPVIVIRTCYTMLAAQIMYVTISDDIAPRRRVTPPVNCSLVIHLTAYIGYVAELNGVIIAVHQNGHAGRMAKCAVTDTVTDTVYPYGRLDRYGNP